MQSFMENNCVAMALAPDADRWTGDPSTDVYNLEGYDEITFLFIEGAGGTGYGTITVYECDDTTPSNATAIAFDYKTATSCDTTATWSAWTRAASTGVAPAAGANKMTAVRVRASELSAGYPFVKATMTETDSTAVDAAVVAVLSGPRYAQEVPLDPTS